MTLPDLMKSQQDMIRIFKTSWKLLKTRIKLWDPAKLSHFNAHWRSPNLRLCYALILDSLAAQGTFESLTTLPNCIKTLQDLIKIYEDSSVFLYNWWTLFMNLSIFFKICKTFLKVTEIVENLFETLYDSFRFIEDASRLIHNWSGLLETWRLSKALLDFPKPFMTLQDSWKLVQVFIKLL